MELLGFHEPLKAHVLGLFENKVKNQFLSETCCQVLMKTSHAEPSKPFLTKTNALID